MTVEILQPSVETRLVRLASEWMHSATVVAWNAPSSRRGTSGKVRGGKRRRHMRTADDPNRKNNALISIHGFLFFDCSMADVP